MKPKLISDFSGIHRIRQILLVGKDKQEGIAKIVLVQHALEFFPGLGNTLAIVGINNKNYSLCVLEIFPGRDL